MSPYQHWINDLLIAETLLATAMVFHVGLRLRYGKRKIQMRSIATADVIFVRVQSFCLGAVLSLASVNLLLILANHRATVDYISHKRQQLGPTSQAVVIDALQKGAQQ